MFEGLHDAIIDMETWEAAQKLVARHPRQKHTHPLKNPLGGVLVCGKCGRAMTQHPYKHAEDRLECRTQPRCYKSVKKSHVEAAVVAALEEAELPALQLKVKNGEGKAVKIQQRLLEKLEKQMAELVEQEDKQYEFLETGRYSQDVFDRRHATLREKMEDCQKKIYETKATMPKDVDYEERVVALKNAIKMLKDPKASPQDKNKMLRAIVERIEYTGIPSDHLNRKRNVKGHNPFSLKIFLRL